MQIQINGKQIDIGDALRVHVEERLVGAVDKYAGRAVNSQVTFSRDGHSFRCDALVHLPTGLVAQASAAAPEIYAACDACVERIDKQLRRYKRRLKDHHAARGEPIEASPASAYVIAAHEGDDEASEPPSLDPVIVAEMRMDIQKISVGEAVMQMELAHAPFLMFRNQRHGGLNVVYRREDGNIGWVDPENLVDGAA
ncbi:ribosome hibernation-promoting factor, HPF/YfiA family [Rubrimonas cliftonensis]|uniref:Ribosome hibernation promoting factor n=1 Tax=Rubrimonas cliftonensis TaxID=89524 RepID=A0A1H4A6T8_9RHOB|nr:ribosome-associated translation inhibitor RaiA [Rubrimonas cliftonensis]SEA31518.1 SSU ribosomal protein S30P /sigma 54 modulation protein [Rubrimonas cliftonensis]